MAQEYAFLVDGAVLSSQASLRDILFCLLWFNSQEMVAVSKREIQLDKTDPEDVAEKENYSKNAESI